MELIKLAQQKILETALSLKNSLKFVDALATFGNSIFGRYDPEAEKFREGISLIRDAINSKHCRTLADAFMFTGVSDGLKDLSLEILEERFSQDEKMMVMHFLEQWGNVPHSWEAKKEKEFREEVKAILP